MTTIDQHQRSLWSRLPLPIRAVTVGLLVAIPAANVLPLLATTIDMRSALVVELLFLGLFLWWTSGGGSPKSSKSVRTTAFRAGRLSGAQWRWGIVAALAFAITIHAAMVVLFRLVPFPSAAFHLTYFERLPSLQLKWLATIVAAASAGITEEVGFRGYMQQPLEHRYGVIVAIFLSSIFFMLLHLNQSWATVAMLPIGVGIAVLLGLLAWASGSLIPGIIGHTVMDIGLFAYWWTGIAGTFTARTISQTGVDVPFEIACAVSMTALLVVSASIWRLRMTRKE